MTTATESRALRPIDEVRHTLTRMSPEFKAALPPHVTPEKFVRVTLTAIQTAAAQGQDLLECDRTSLYAACMRCAQIGLLADGREAALVKYGNKVQLLPMVEGLMKHVRNSGEIVNISVQVVRENDEFDYELGDNERILHKPAIKDRGDIIGAYSIVTLKGGEKSREWMSIDEIEGIRKRSRSADRGPWVTDYSEMAKKTVFRRHYKRLPKSTDLDDIVREEDEVEFAPPQPAAPPAEKEVQGEVQPPARNSRLQAAVDAAVEPVGGAPAGSSSQPGDPI